MNGLIILLKIFLVANTENTLYSFTGNELEKLKSGNPILKAIVPKTIAKLDCELFQDKCLYKCVFKSEISNNNSFNMQIGPSDKVSIYGYTGGFTKELKLIVNKSKCKIILHSKLPGIPTGNWWHADYQCEGGITFNSDGRKIDLLTMVSDFNIKNTSFSFFPSPEKFWQTLEESLTRPWKTSDFEEAFVKCGEIGELAKVPLTYGYLDNNITRRPYLSEQEILGTFRFGYDSYEGRNYAEYIKSSHSYDDFLTTSNVLKYIEKRNCIKEREVSLDYLRDATFRHLNEFNWKKNGYNPQNHIYQCKTRPRIFHIIADLNKGKIHAIRYLYDPNDQ